MNKANMVQYITLQSSILATEAISLFPCKIFVRNKHVRTTKMPNNFQGCQWDLSNTSNLEILVDLSIDIRLSKSNDSWLSNEYVELARSLFPSNNVIPAILLQTFSFYGISSFDSFSNSSFQWIYIPLNQDFIAAPTISRSSKIVIIGLGRYAYMIMPILAPAITGVKRIIATV